jgi:hypothetical protein
MAKSIKERDNDRNERNKKAGLTKITAWIPASKRDEFLQLAAAWIAEHKAKLEKDCPDE